MSVDMSRHTATNDASVHGTESSAVIYHKRELISNYVKIKCHLDATEVFIADLIACSTCFGHHYAHHQELKSKPTSCKPDA